MSTIAYPRVALDQQFVAAPSLALGIAFAAALSGILACWRASTLDARTTTDAAAR